MMDNLNKHIWEYKDSVRDDIATLYRRNADI